MDFLYTFCPLTSTFVTDFIWITSSMYTFLWADLTTHYVSWSIGKKIVSRYSQYLTKTIWSNNKPYKVPKQKSTGLSTLEEVLSAVRIETKNSLDCVQLSSWTKNWLFCSIILPHKLVFCLFQGCYQSSNALSKLRNTLNYTILSAQWKNWQKWPFCSLPISETWFSFRFTFRSLWFTWDPQNKSKPMPEVSRRRPKH